jgi:hypothetical protein
VGSNFLKVIAAILLCVTAALGQSTSGQIMGRVTDPQGRGVPDALVKLTNADMGTTRDGKTNESGSYLFPLVPPGNYRLAVTKEGFRPVNQSGIALAVDQAARIDVALEIGAVTQAVEVTAAAPLVDQETSALGQVVDAVKIQNLPLNGRSPFRLVQLTPGLLTEPGANGQFGDVPVNTNWDTNFSINGSHQMSNEILIDGVPSTTGQFNTITTIPTIEATQEFKVQSNNLSAEWGRFNGGVVNVSTRSGSNSVHGAMYEYMRNNVFDSNEYFNKAGGRDIPPFHMNQFGGAVGGPVWLGRWYNGKNRTFFFSDYQGTRWRRGATFRTSVPTAQQRAGDFTQTFNQTGQLVTIYDPLTTVNNIRTPFAGNRVPTSRMNPIALKMIDYIPGPNSPGDPFTNFNNFASNAPTRVDGNQFSGRIDHNISDAWRTFVRVAHNRSNLGQPDYFNNVATPGAGSVGVTFFHQTTAAWDHTVTLSPNTILNVKYGFARWYQFRATRSYGFDVRTLGYSDAIAKQFQIPVFPTVTVEQYNGLGGQTYFNSGNDTHTLNGSITKVMGKHTLKTGAEVRLNRVNFILIGGGSGTYSFTRAYTRGPNALTVYDNAGSGLASLLMGIPASGSAPMIAGVSLQNYYTGAYLQDDIRISNRFTMNIGLRYESESPFTERYNSINYFDPTLQSPVRNSAFPDLRGGLVFANASNRHVWQWNTVNFSPRLGFAYSVDRKTALRWGAGIFRAPAETSNVATAFASNSGYSASTPMVASNDGGNTPFRNLSNPFPDGILQPTRNSLGASTNLGQGLSVWDYNQLMPTTYQWNIDLQRQLPEQVLIDVAYAGSRGMHLGFRNFSMNELDPKYLSLGTALNQSVANPFYGSITTGNLGQPTVTRRQLLLPYPQFTGITVVNRTLADSIYHSLQVKVEKRFSHGVSGLLAYTAGKLISDANNDVQQVGATNASNVQNWYNLRGERSLSELDVSRNLSSSYVVELPFGPGRRFFNSAGRITGRLIGGWQINGITTWRTGMPLTVSTTIVGGGNRPNSTGKSALISGSRSRAEMLNRWFDITQFTQPVSYSLGNVGRTLPDVRGPSIFNQDLSLIKNTRIRETVTLQLRFEYFNAFNHPNFDLPNTGLNSGAFGRITSTVLLPRVGQVAAKLNF